MEQLTMTLKPPTEAPAIDDDSEPATAPQVLTVSELNRAVRSALEGEFSILWVKGELSNFKPHTSGHWYFSLKDSKAQISAVMFRGFNQGIRFRPTDGMEVIVRGKITVYEPRGNYQVFCEVMEPVGAGAMQLAFEQLKAKLQAEGLFAPERKRPLPMLPKHVAVVTSPTGAAIRDILNVLHRRFKGLRVTVVPAVVQGAQAPASIVAALKMAAQLKDVDVMIVGRGGGSMEDLWAFNDERVVRAIAAAKVPTISAVGHEIDFTIADFVADLRAPTPSAAAELVVRSAAELQERLRLNYSQLQKLMRHRLEIFRRQVALAAQRLVDPKRRLQDLAQRCDDLFQRLDLALRNQLERRKARVTQLRGRLGNPQERLLRWEREIEILATKLGSFMQMNLDRNQARLSQLGSVLDSLSPLKVLDRGYAIATHANEVIRSTRGLKVKDAVSIRLSSGQFKAHITEIENDSENDSEEKK